MSRAWGMRDLMLLPFRRSAFWFYFKLQCSLCCYCCMSFSLTFSIWGACCIFWFSGRAHIHWGLFWWFVIVGVCLCLGFFWCVVGLVVCLVFFPSVHLFCQQYLQQKHGSNEPFPWAPSSPAHSCTASLQIQLGTCAGGLSPPERIGKNRLLVTGVWMWLCDKAKLFRLCQPWIFMGSVQSCSAQGCGFLAAVGSEWHQRGQGSWPCCSPRCSWIRLEMSCRGAAEWKCSSWFALLWQVDFYAKYTLCKRFFFGPLLTWGFHSFLFPGDRLSPCWDQLGSCYSV